MLSKEIEIILNKAFIDADEHHHEKITVEHLLYALMHDQSVTKALESKECNINELKEELSVYIEEHVSLLPPNTKRKMEPTLGFQRVLQRAVFHAQASDKKDVDGVNLLVALFSEQDSHAVYLLNKQDIQRLDIVDYITHGVQKKDNEEEIEKAFEEQYDEDFDYKTLLSLKEVELNETRTQLENEKIEKEQERVKTLELIEKIQVLESKLVKFDTVQTKNKILRSIKFKPEHRQAGLSILSYFSEVVDQKYPKKKISVSIEQAGDIVKLCIQTEEGDKEIIEKTLAKYGRIVTQGMSPKKIFVDPIYVAQLEHKLDLAHAEIRSTERLLEIKNDTINDLKESMQSFFQINTRQHTTLDNALNKIGGNKEVDAAIMLIKELAPKQQLTKNEIDKVKEIVEVIYAENPSTLEELESYLVSVSSSMVGSLVLDMIKNLGFI